MICPDFNSEKKEINSKTGKLETVVDIRKTNGALAVEIGFFYHVVIQENESTGTAISQYK